MEAQQKPEGLKRLQAFSLTHRKPFRSRGFPFGRICNPPAVSMRIFNPTRTVTTCFGHSVGQSH